MPLLDAVTKTGQWPLNWPKVVYEENEIERFPIVLMGCLVYGLTTYYYQVCWKASIIRTNKQGEEKKKPKPKHFNGNMEAFREEFTKQHAD